MYLLNIKQLIGAGCKVSFDDWTNIRLNENIV